MENSLSAYQELLGRLNRSKTRQRRGSDGGRSAPAREALRKEQEALRDKRRKGITLLGSGIRTADFQDWNGNRIDDRDEPGGSYYSDKSVSSPEEKTPTTSSNRALTKDMLNQMAWF